MTLTKRQDAPGELELVREFVNTRNLKTSTDALATAQDGERWLRKRHLLGPTGKVDGQGLEYALELRGPTSAGAGQQRHGTRPIGRRRA